MRLRKISAWLTGAFAFGAALAATSVAGAQESPTGFALQRFNAAAAGDRFFSVPSAYASGDPGFHVSLLVDYAAIPLALRRLKGLDSTYSVVSEQAYLHLNASFALFDRILLNIDVPAAFANAGSSPTLNGVTFGSPKNAAFGDLRFGARVRLFGEERDAFQVGLNGYFWVPTGSVADFTSDGEVRGMPQLVLGGKGDRFVWSFSGGAQLRKNVTYNDVKLGSTMDFGAGLAVRLGDQRQVQLGPEATVSINLEDSKRRNTQAELLIGAKYRFLKNIEVGVAAGPGLTPGYGTPDLRVVGSFSYTPDRYPPPEPPKDTDGDGVMDPDDQCVNEAFKEPQDPKRRGCTAPPDGDKDGISDAEDACPAVAGVAHADAKRNGCPGDQDDDGVLDAQDKCPDVPVKGAADPLQPGCPAPPDTDGDAIIDREDACPTIKGIASADPATRGCPGDSDGDGVRDDEDACPEVRGGKDPSDPKKNGCPRLVRLFAGEIVILQQVQFQTGTAKLTGNSDEILSEVANVMKEKPEILKLEVQGHTDNKGSKANNKTLSQKRAESVLKALAGKGIEAGRLVATGYGQEKPIASNDDEEGRAKNRRVQFKILEKKK